LSLFSHGIRKPRGWADRTVTNKKSLTEDYLEHTTLDPYLLCPCRSRRLITKLTQTGNGAVKTRRNHQERIQTNLNHRTLQVVGSFVASDSLNLDNHW